MIACTTQTALTRPAAPSTRGAGAGEGLIAPSSQVPGARLRCGLRWPRPSEVLSEVPAGSLVGGRTPQMGGRPIRGPGPYGESRVTSRGGRHEREPVPLPRHPRRAGGPPRACPSRHVAQPRRPGAGRPPLAAARRHGGDRRPVRVAGPAPRRLTTPDDARRDDVIATAAALWVSGGTIVPVAPISAAAPFVGRARELARLELLLEQAVAGSAAGVLLAGDAGVGKTRLVTELLSRARAAGAVAVLGHCVDLGAGGLPYLPFAEALTETVRAGEAPGAPGHVAEAAAAVRAMARQRPVLRRLTGDVEGAGRDEGPERMPLYEAVLEALHAVTDAVAPVLLVLEDLHWADASTRDLLRFVLARLGDERLLVVGTYRTDDLHRRHPLRPLLAELVRLPRVERVDVAPFDGPELAEYLSVLHGGTVPDALVEDIRGRSEGNAYYAEELLAAAGDTPSPRASRRVALPEQLVDVLLARLEGLPP